MTKLDFIKLCNSERKANKNKWVMLSGIVEGVNVQYKAFNTWVQVLNVDGKKSSNGMDESVSQYNQFLNEYIL